MASSQGSTVTFNGGQLGQVLSWITTPATAVVQDMTNYDSDLVGTGWTSRVLKSRDCTAIEPGTASATMLGNPGYAWSDVGTKGMLEITCAAGSIAFEAILTKYEIQGSVGELLKYAAEWQYTGG